MIDSNSIFNNRHNRYKSITKLIKCRVIVYLIIIGEFHEVFSYRLQADLYLYTLTLLLQIKKKK